MVVLTDVLIPYVATKQWRRLTYISQAPSLMSSYLTIKKSLKFGIQPYPDKSTSVTRDVLEHQGEQFVSREVLTKRHCSLLTKWQGFGDHKVRGSRQSVLDDEVR
jgi:hypothetical protein